MNTVLARPQIAGIGGLSAAGALRHALIGAPWTMSVTRDLTSCSPRARHIVQRIEEANATAYRLAKTANRSSRGQRKCAAIS